MAREKDGWGQWSITKWLYYWGELFLDLLAELVVKVLSTLIWRHRTKTRPKRIILVRHGESLGNKYPSTYFDVPDNLIPLTDKGRREAREAGESLKQLIGNETVSFYVSPFLRTAQTFEEMIKAFDRGQYWVRYEPRIREQEWGFLPGKESFEEARAKRQHVGRFFFRFQGGESGADVYDRVTSFLHTLFREFDSKGGQMDNVILVSHGFTCRVFIMRYFHYSYQEMESWENLRNCEYVILEKNKSGAYECITPLERNPLAPPLTDHGPCMCRTCSKAAGKGPIPPRDKSRYSVLTDIFRND